jgi:hypothetical protein
MRSVFRISLTVLLLTIGINGRLGAQSPLKEASHRAGLMPRADEDAGNLPERIETKPAQAKPGIIGSLFPWAVAEEDGDGDGASAGAAAGGEAAGSSAETSKPFWALSPPVEVFSRPGWFPLPPTTPGSYSLLDCVRGEYLKGPPKYPYPRFSIIAFPFFYCDWRYLDDPNNDEHDYWDCIKRVHIGDNFLFTDGGEFRVQYHTEKNSRLTGKDNEFDLTRLRVYSNFWYQDIFRIYVEGLDARLQGGRLPPAVIDVDHADLLNAFFDLKVATICGDPVYVRGGRQELLYGSQRLISPLDFADTRRTFQGVKGFWHSDKLDIDAFCVQPIVPNPTHFDSVDNNQIFSGLWATYRPAKNQYIDLYALNLDNTNETKQLGIQRAPTNVTTFGGRYVGDYDGRWMWEVEPMVQTGTLGDRTLLADAMAVGGGYCFKCVPTKPQFWVYYEYASGDKTPNVGRDSTFNQLFPFGHYYFGGTDDIGRQNIHDLNGQFVFYPTYWITCLAQYHILSLDSATDALYNSGGVAIRRDPTGRAGTNVGEVLDLVVNFHLDKHTDIFIQGCHLFDGEFLQKTGSPRDANCLYLQFSYRW